MAEQVEDAGQAHWDEGYTFHILEKRKILVEISPLTIFLLLQ